MSVIQEKISEIDQQPVFSFRLKNEQGIEVEVMNYGCIITKIMAPDKNGIYENIVLGHDSLEEYIQDPYYLGAVCGRVAGRIGDGSFELDGKTYTLTKNDRNNHLHGGRRGFNKIVWDAEIIGEGVRFTYISPDGEEGYPGNVKISITYTLDNVNQLTIHYEADTDRKTLLTLTNHSYFNLSGNLKHNVLQHTLKIKSDRYSELNQEFIPTGELRRVKGTPFDFTTEKSLEIGAGSVHPQNVLVGNGYDHPFLLSDNHEEEIVLKDAASGRALTVETDEPGVVVYSGNSLGAEDEFRGRPSEKYLGICLETQRLPDAIHHPHFPSIVLDAGESYSSRTIYRFGAE
ncbi:aldose epimerase family protein [Bacillus sp. AK031]